MRHTSNYGERIESILFIGSFLDEKVAIDVIHEEAESKERFLKELFFEDDDKVRIETEDDDFSVSVLFGQEESYDYFYIDGTIDTKTYADITY